MIIGSTHGLVDVRQALAHVITQLRPDVVAVEMDTVRAQEALRQLGMPASQDHVLHPADDTAGASAVPSPRAVLSLACLPRTPPLLTIVPDKDVRDEELELPVARADGAELGDMDTVLAAAVGVGARIVAIDRDVRVTLARAASAGWAPLAGVQSSTWRTLAAYSWALLRGDLHQALCITADDMQRSVVAARSMPHIPARVVNGAEEFVKALRGVEFQRSSGDVQCTVPDTLRLTLQPMIELASMYANEQAAGSVPALLQAVPESARASLRALFPASERDEVTEEQRFISAFTLERDVLLADGAHQLPGQLAVAVVGSGHLPNVARALGRVPPDAAAALRQPRGAYESYWNAAAWVPMAAVPAWTMFKGLRKAPVVTAAALVGVAGAAGLVVQRHHSLGVALKQAMHASD